MSSHKHKRMTTPWHGTLAVTKSEHPTGQQPAIRLTLLPPHAYPRADVPALASTPQLDDAPSNLRPALVDHPLFREQSYHTLSRQDAARWADLGTYRA